MANLNRLIGSICYGTLALIAAGLAGYAIISLHPPKKLSSTDAGVTQTYVEYRRLFEDPFCYIRLSDSEVTDYYEDRKCDGSVDFAKSVKGAEGSYRITEETWRTRENESEFKDYDKFFSMVKGSLEERSKK